MMSRNHEILTAVGTLACAVGIGFFMQSGQEAQSRYGQPIVVPKVQGPIALPPKQDVIGAMKDGAVLSVESIILTSADVANTPVFPSFDEPVTTFNAPHSSLESPVMNMAAPGCPVRLSASTSAAAMVDLSLDAPCWPNERLSVHHNGLIITEMTSDAGQLHLSLPALSQSAVFEVNFASGPSAKADVSVDTLGLYDRVVVQWTGKDAVQLHAREFGANYGDTGHVWSGASRDIQAVASGEGGFMTRHGNPQLAAARQAEVYTFPKAMAQTAGQVDLTVEAEVTTATCGRNLNAKTIQLGSDGDVTIREIALSVPDCGAQGDFLVLNNLLQDLKVAQK